MTGSLLTLRLNIQTTKRDASQSQTINRFTMLDAYYHVFHYAGCLPTTTYFTMLDAYPLPRISLCLMPTHYHIFHYAGCLPTTTYFTMLDAYPLPRISLCWMPAYPLPHIHYAGCLPTHYHVLTILSILLHSTEFSVPLIYGSAYHQVKINDSDKPYTVFQARNALYQFTQVPFGVTNGLACFQRAMDSIVTEEQLQATFPYLDNITICGKDQREHDVNLKRFLEATSRRQIKYNDSKYVFSTRKLSILGSIIEEGDIRPDPERL